MGRVRLTAGAVSPGQVRLRPSGASERLRRPGDDINYNTRLGESCRGCVRRPAVPDSGRLKLCQRCAPDGRAVAEVAAALKAAGQPPLLAAVPAGGPLHKLRTRGVQAQARLDARRRTVKETLARASTTSTTGRREIPRSGRRLSEQDKRAGARRLQERAASLERRLREASALYRPHELAKMEEEFVAARRLLARWDYTH
jgi:hypothetical protein